MLQWAGRVYRTVSIRLMSDIKLNGKHTNDPAGGLTLGFSEMASLLDLSKRLGGILDIQELCRTLSGYLQESFAIKAFAIYMRRVGTKTFEWIYARGMEDVVSEFESDNEPFWQSISRGDPFLVADEAENLLFPGVIRAQRLKQMASSWWIPLRKASEPIGVLVVDRWTPSAAFDDGEQLCLKELADQIAGCISNCLLFGQRQSEKEQLDKSVQNLSLLYSIGRALNDISDLKSLLKYILVRAIEIAHVEKGSIMTHSMDTGLLGVRVMQGLKDQELQERINNSEAICRNFRPGEGIAGKVFETGEPIIASRLADDPSFVAGESSFARSIICIPMVVYDEVLGVINLTNRKDSAEFTSEDMELLKAVADQAAVAYNKHQLWDMSITDSLTGLYDRRYFKIRLMDESQRAERYDKKLSIAMADLDNFKAINDTYGHGVGDQFLIAIGSYLQINVRNVDLVARYGGEEFIMFFPETDNDTARSLTERIRQGVSRIRIPSYPGITISFGIATYPVDGEDMNDLIRRADMAMYAAKQLGRNRVVAYTKDVDQLWENKRIPG